MIEYLKQLISRDDPASSKNLLAIVMGFTIAICIIVVVLAIIVLKQNHDTTLMSLLGAGGLGVIFHKSE